MIKNILFDCGGVFVEVRFKELMEVITGDAEKATHFYEMLFAPDNPWPALYDKGECDTEGCYALLQKRHPELRPEHLRRFMQEWVQWLPTFPEMETIIPELHAAGYQCYLLSNFSHRFEEFRQNYCPALKELDGAVISYAVKMIKPDPKIFEYTAAHLGIAPEETLFIDDAPANVEAARNVGYQAYHYTDAKALRAYLKELQILPR